MAMPRFHEQVTHGTTTNFEQEVTKSPIPVLVFFWTDWCQPCGLAIDRLNHIAEEFGHRLKIVEFNADNCPTIAKAHSICGIPAFVFYKTPSEGSVETIIGAVFKIPLVSKLFYWGML